MFDECFEFSVTLEQCLMEGSMIAFTVMDHDVLTANDFAGEAFLTLNTIPGVADYNASVVNFHGLKAVDLPLMQQHDKSMFLFIFFKMSFLMIFFQFRYRSSDFTNIGITYN